MLRALDTFIFLVIDFFDEIIICYFNDFSEYLPGSGFKHICKPLRPICLENIDKYNTERCVYNTLNKRFIPPWIRRHRHRRHSKFLSRKICVVYNIRKEIVKREMNFVQTLDADLTPPVYFRSPSYRSQTVWMQLHAMCLTFIRMWLKMRREWAISTCFCINSTRLAALWSANTPVNRDLNSA